MSFVSSPHSSQPDTRSDLEIALASVAEDSFYAMVDSPEPEWRETWSAERNWLQATVRFHGAAEGVVTCRLPRSLAVSLAAAFLGLSEEEVADSEETIRDMVGELTNMVCGCWLTRQFRAELFRLDQPEIAAATDLPPASWLVTTVNGAPLAMQISMAQG
jgi:CheY-specific phosphatase CheX